MLKKNDFHFVSIEGNWDKTIHDKRIEHAAAVLKEDQSALAIASGTYAPPPYSSFYGEQLGKYTKEILMNIYGIPAMRILPAYLFPYKSTYTTMDAFANAALIGWVSCGLEKRSDGKRVLFEPNTCPFHGLRVELLNNRACQYLHDFRVEVELLCRNKLSEGILGKDYPEEAARLSKLQGDGGLIATGEWLDDGEKRSYDDLDRMKYDLVAAFKSVFNFSLSEFDIYSMSDAERLMFTLSWNQLANGNRLSEMDFENTGLYAEAYFGVKISGAANSSFVRPIVHQALVSG